MHRRDFHRGAVGSAVVSLFGVVACGGGGGGGAEGAAAPAAAAGTPPSTPAPAGAPAAATPAAGPAPAPAPPPAAALVATIGTNLSGMEWAGGVRAGPNTRHNLDFTVPRAADIRWLAANGFGRNRLPVMWELLQPMLADTVANAQARALIGEPGALDERYAGFIDGVLDAHAAAGSRCILDLHNYARYRDFRFRPDGSVAGLTRPDPQVQAYTTDAAQVFTRIFATAPGATLRPAAFADLWRRMAQRWGRHPGFGGYGLMNEPHHLPLPGQVTDSEAVDGRGEDLMIWPAFARAAIDAIRAVDPAGTVYLSGNAWGGAMNIGPEYNPAWPLPGSNLVYEVHAYVDAFNNGNGFDWELEVAKNYTAGFGVGPMTADTGVNRLRIATDWARANGQRIALTETGMPVDDPRWADAFRRLLRHAWENRVEVQSWMGGSHWAARNHAINHNPNWYQDRTLEPQVAGELKAVAGVDSAQLFDEGPAWVEAGSPVTLTVQARGHLAAPVTLSVRSDAGGPAQAVVLPAGPNPRASFRVSPPAGRITTLTYEAQPARQVPPPRRLFALADPVAHAGTSLADAAHAILARYSAAQWDLARAWTDFVLGRPAADGDEVRAVADSGFASSTSNPMEMLNGLNQDRAGMGPLRPGLLRTAGAPHLDLTGEGATGLWCRKVVPGPTHPAARQQAPYGVGDPHFVVAAIGLPVASASGVVFQATVTGQPWHVELGLAGGRPQARWRDTAGGSQVLLGPALAAGTRAVLSLVGGGGRQQLRVDRAVVGSGSARIGAGPVSDLLVGWGDPHRGNAATFRGHVYAVLTGRGAPSEAELAVLERYLASRMGG